MSFRQLRKSVLHVNCMNIQTASAPRTSNIHSRCGKPFAKNVNSLRSDRTFFAHSTSFVHVEVLRLVQIVWIVHTISFRAEFHNCPYKNPRTPRRSCRDMRGASAPSNAHVTRSAEGLYSSSWDCTHDEDRFHFARISRLKSHVLRDEE